VALFRRSSRCSTWTSPSSQACSRFPNGCRDALFAEYAASANWWFADHREQVTSANAVRALSQARVNAQSSDDRRPDEKERPPTVGRWGRRKDRRPSSISCVSGEETDTFPTHDRSRRNPARNSERFGKALRRTRRSCSRLAAYRSHAWPLLRLTPRQRRRARLLFVDNLSWHASVTQRLPEAIASPRRPFDNRLVSAAVPARRVQRSGVVPRFSSPRA
jgi:hypothetical protein